MSEPNSIHYTVTRRSKFACVIETGENTNSSTRRQGGIVVVRSLTAIYDKSLHEWLQLPGITLPTSHRCCHRYSQRMSRRWRFAIIYPRLRV